MERLHLHWVWSYEAMCYIIEDFFNTGLLHAGPYTLLFIKNMGLFMSSDTI